MKTFTKNILQLNKVGYNGPTNPIAMLELFNKSLTMLSQIVSLIDGPKKK